MQWPNNYSKLLLLLSRTHLPLECLLPGSSADYHSHLRCLPIFAACHKKLEDKILMPTKTFIGEEDLSYKSKTRPQQFKYVPRLNTYKVFFSSPIVEQEGNFYKNVASHQLNCFCRIYFLNFNDAGPIGLLKVSRIVSFAPLLRSRMSCGKSDVDAASGGDQSTETNEYRSEK